MRSPEGKELSTRMVGLALLAMALVTAAFAVTVARADEGAGTQWNSVLAGINERPTPRDTHARGVAVFELSADGESMHYKVIAANINNVIMAHIHLGDANTAGPVIVWLYPIGRRPPAAPAGAPLRADPAAREEHLVRAAQSIQRNGRLPHTNLGPHRYLEDRTPRNSGKRTLVCRGRQEGAARDEEHVPRGRLDDVASFVEEDGIECALGLGLSEGNRFRSA